MIDGALVFEATIVGMIDASQTRTPCTPFKVWQAILDARARTLDEAQAVS